MLNVLKKIMRKGTHGENTNIETFEVNTGMHNTFYSRRNLCPFNDAKK